MIVGACLTPDVGFRIPTRALLGQTQTRAATDAATCEAEALAGAEVRELRYAACMIARGYASFVDVPPGGSGYGRLSAKYEVSHAAPGAGEAVLRELSGCADEAVRVARDATCARILAAATGMVGAGPLHAALDRTFRACLEAKRYALAPWP